MFSLIRSLLTAAALIPALFATPAEAKPPPEGCQEAFSRSDFHSKARATYRSDTPVTRSERAAVRQRVVCQRSAKSKRVVRMHLARYKRHHKIRRQWAYYRAHPMPACTWVGESGGSYTARNPTSTAGGKYQIIDSTWWANGGGRYPVRHPAAAAPPLEQERVARRVLASQGRGAWVLC